MIGTEKVAKFRKWYSLKAIMILNTIECVFWLVLIMISCMSVKACNGLGCTLSGLTIMFGFLLLYVFTSHPPSRSWRSLINSFLAIPVAYVSIRHHSHYKKHGYHPDEKHHLNEGRQLPLTRTESSEVYRKWEVSDLDSELKLWVRFMEQNSLVRVRVGQDIVIHVYLNSQNVHKVQIQLSQQ